MNRQDYVFGRRIVVRGVTGSGKSTLARALGDALGLTAIELDYIHWQRPNWEPLPPDEFRVNLAEALDAAPAGWVVDGNYSSVTDLVIERADTLVWINLPFRVSFYRVVKRTLGRWRRKEVLWDAQQERLRDQFFSKESLFLWAITHHKPTARRVQQIVRDNPRLRVYELRSQKEVMALVEAARGQGVTA